MPDPALCAARFSTLTLFFPLHTLRYSKNAPHFVHLFPPKGGKRLQHARDFEENVSDFATDCFGTWQIGGNMFCREPRIGMREILRKMSPILRQIVLAVQDEYRVMRGKWDGVEEEMIVQCHGWPSLVSVLVSMI